MPIRVRRLPLRDLTTTRAVVLSVLISLAVALWNIGTFSLAPPGFHKRPLQIAAAASRVFVDAPQSWVLSKTTSSVDYQNLSRRADLLAVVNAD